MVDIQKNDVPFKQDFSDLPEKEFGDSSLKENGNAKRSFVEALKFGLGIFAAGAVFTGLAEAGMVVKQAVDHQLTANLLNDVLPSVTQNALKIGAVTGCYGVGVSLLGRFLSLSHDNSDKF